MRSRRRPLGHRSRRSRRAASAAADARHRAGRARSCPASASYRDGDRVRHARWGDGIVVKSKLTRSDEEVTVAFNDPSVGRKTVLASLANLEVVG